MLDAAKEKLRAITHGLPDPVYAQQEHLRLLNDAPGYAAFFLTSLDRHDRLLQAKPILVQGGFSPRFLPAPPRVALFNAKPLFQNVSRMTHGSSSWLSCSSTRPRDA